MKGEYIIDGKLVTQEITEKKRACRVHKFVTEEICVRKEWGATMIEKCEYCCLCGVIPHADGRYDYICSSEWCRCRQ